MSRDRHVAVLLGGILFGLGFAWACGPFVPEANAQDDAGGACASWEVRWFYKNTDDTCVDNEARFQMTPSPCSETGAFGSILTADPAAATLALPDGFEPFAVQEANVVLGRRCAD